MFESKEIRGSQLVLVVDDHEINRDILGGILEDHYDVIYAENGREALEQIRAHINDLALVLLDLVMPEMNGFEVLQYAKNDEQMSKIPFIVLTAEKSAELEALQLGAVDFITKPIDMHEVINARVSRVIELSDGKKLIQAAERDKLTGLYTKNFFFEYINRILKVHGDEKYDAVVLNIEQFHTVNALHGREFGDKVLIGLADAIRQFLTGTKGVASRIESDRFFIYCQQQEDYHALLNRFQEAVNAIAGNTGVHIRMGVKTWEDKEDPFVMFDNAVTACNKVRGDFQNPLMIYDENMRIKEVRDQELLNDLDQAIEEHQFQVFYQPKYDIKQNPPRLASAEALIRWNHPKLGMLSPGDFVPLFERNGLITKVDHYVWEVSTRQIAEWRDQFGFELPISVNLSRADVFDPDLINRLVKLVADNHLKEGSLKLEVTETSYTDNARVLLDVIDKLRSSGFEIEMDDFGSGYSSLNMLSDMPIDVLKMDMKFVRNIEDNMTDLKLVELILDIAGALQLTVVAEGVEKEGQLQLLKNAGCDLVQGYYFSKPVPAEEFQELIKKEIENERNRQL
ncbi:MAG: EAL domain-containing protein [Solobacterium sp.]|nr:EAL domain-containing protein [Solobacterium sp.]